MCFAIRVLSVPRHCSTGSPSSHYAFRELPAIPTGACETSITMHMFVDSPPSHSCAAIFAEAARSPAPVCQIFLSWRVTGIGVPFGDIPFGDRLTLMESFSRMRPHQSRQKEFGMAARSYDIITVGGGIAVSRLAKGMAERGAAVPTCPSTNKCVRGSLANADCICLTLFSGIQL